jgi:hypothetical protein
MIPTGLRTLGVQDTMVTSKITSIQKNPLFIKLAYLMQSPCHDHEGPGKTRFPWPLLHVPS